MPIISCIAFSHVVGPVTSITIEFSLLQLENMHADNLISFFVWRPAFFALSPAARPTGITKKQETPSRLFDRFGGTTSKS